LTLQARRGPTDTSVDPGLADAAEWARAELLLGTPPELESSGRRLVLRPWEGRVYRRGIPGRGAVEYLDPI
jgi:hypothetical protein